MTKHSGPWGVKTGQSDQHGCPGEIHSNHGEKVCWVGAGGSSNSIQFADDEVKRLILAAPQMLEALKRVESCCDCGLDEEARALIARIEGG